jgi:transposase
MNESSREVSTSLEVDTKQACVPGRRRHWPAALKRQIVEETFAPGASASVVARRYDVNANQLFRWRRDWRDGLLGRRRG